MTLSDSPTRRALISVHNKAGLVELATALVEQDFILVSTGGTARAIGEAGLPVVDVASVTGFPEMLDGRVKTLHPAIHAGILARRDLAHHRTALEKHDLAAFDLVVVNLYPFEATVASGADFDTCIENIDIGGPSLIRGAAKNHEFVTVLTDPSDYPAILEELQENGGVTKLETRRRLAGLAYARTAAYDSAISSWMARERGEDFPQTLAMAGQRKQIMRYGENPHQKAAFYTTADKRQGVGSARQIQGKELSYNNLNDTDAAFECVAEFDEPAVAIIKHANPCGVATATTLKDAYVNALRCDPVSAFGGILAFNRPLDEDTAQEIGNLFAEVIIAPEVTPSAKEVLARKTQLRILVTGGMPDPSAEGFTYRSLSGGFLIQGRDSGRPMLGDLQVVTKRRPTDEELEDLLFAFRVAKHVKSNAIVYAKAGATVGIGAGQMSRVDSSRIAAWKAQEAGIAAEGISAASPAVGSVVASDAFFPFADGLLAAADAGATAIIQPGGSKRDSEVIAAADERGLAMVFTGIRHFRH